MVEKFEGESLNSNGCLGKGIQEMNYDGGQWQNYMEGQRVYTTSRQSFFNRHLLLVMTVAMVLMITIFSASIFVMVIMLEKLKIDLTTGKYPCYLIIDDRQTTSVLDDWPFNLQWHKFWWMCNLFCSLCYLMFDVTMLLVTVIFFRVIDILRGSLQYPKCLILLPAALMMTGLPELVEEDGKGGVGEDNYDSGIPYSGLPTSYMNNEAPVQIRNCQSSSRPQVQHNSGKEAPVQIRNRRSSSRPQVRHNSGNEAPGQVRNHLPSSHPQVQHNSGIRQSGLQVYGNNEAPLQVRYRPSLHPRVQFVSPEHEDISVLHLHGVVYGTENLAKRFAVEIGLAENGSGVVLDMASDVLTLEEGGSSYKYMVDFIILRQFDTKEVYLCMDCRSRRQFILKMVPLENIHGRQIIKRRQQVDIPLTHQGDCPWIAKILGLIKISDSGQDNVQILIEFCEGGSLNDMELLYTWTSEEFAQFFEELLTALVYFHSYRIVHGDLKLDNICMADRSDPKSLRLIDFESVKHPQYPNNYFGTILYLPPWYEEIKRKPMWDQVIKTMDAWAAGIILTVFLSKRFPWYDEYIRLCMNCCVHQPCHHVNSRLLKYIISHPQNIERYYPIVPADTSESLRWLCDLVSQLLPSSGDPQCQTSPAEILENQETAVVSTNKFSTRENRPTVESLQNQPPGNPAPSIQNREPPARTELPQVFQPAAVGRAHIVEVEVFYHGSGRIYSRQVNIRRGLKLKELIELPQMREMWEQIPALGFGFYIEKHNIQGRSQVLTYGGHSIDSDCFLELRPTIGYN